MFNSYLTSSLFCKSNFHCISVKMFHIYWPVIALVASFILISAVLLLMVAGRAGCCGKPCARMETLPDRPLKTYLPETV